MFALPCLSCLINGKHLNLTGLMWFHDVQSPSLKNISTVYPFCLTAEIIFNAPSNLRNCFLPGNPFLFIKLMMFHEGAAGLQEPHIIQMLGEKQWVCRALKYYEYKGKITVLHLFQAAVLYYSFWEVLSMHPSRLWDMQQKHIRFIDKFLL